MKYLSIKDLPKEERPYEKFSHYGVEALTDTELVAILLQNGTKEFSALVLSREVLRFNNEYSVLALCEKSYEELMKIPGIGSIKAMKLKCVFELSKRIYAASRPKMQMFQTASEIAAYYMESMRHLDREQLMAAYFDGSGRLISDEVISVGSVNQSILSPREIFFRAFELRAVYLILIHNHPSGNASPSKQDIELTRSLFRACELVGIPLLDHIIIGDREYVSFKESGRLAF